MSNNGEDIIRETFEKFGDAIGVQMQMPDAMIASLGAVLQAQIDLLAELQSTGRLLADDEQRLTSEQVEDVRTMLWSPGVTALPAFRRLRALFPATEPAEDAKPCGSNSVTLGWCKLTARHEGLHTNGTYLWGTPSEPDPPALAEPAEDIRGLIEKSSLGTESAQALISTVSPEHGRRVAQEAARREAGTKMKLTELQRDLLQRIVDQWTKGAGWTHVFWSGTVEALISAGCIVRHEEAFNEYRPTIFGEKALAPAEPAEEETKAERDSEGIIRINGGRIVALSRDPRELVQQWFDLAEPGSKWQRDYAAALDLFDREAASSPVVPAPTETEGGVIEVPDGRGIEVGEALKQIAAAQMAEVARKAETGPWQNVDAIQVGVPFEDKEGSQLVKLADGKFGYLSYPRETPETLAKYAPFVAAAEEG